MPIAAVAPFVQPITSTLFNLFRLGHADDNVDAEEDRWLQEFVIPIAGKLAGSSGPPFNWVETDRFIAAIDASRSPLSSAEAARIIEQGDQIEKQLCSNFAQQGFACGGKPGYAGGAGRDVPRTWGVLRAKLTEVRDSKALLGLPLSGGAGRGLLSLLVPGGAGGQPGTFQAGFLEKNVVLIGAALIAAWILAYKMGERT